MTSPRKYSSEEKTAAIAQTLGIGPAAAGRELGIPLGTLSCWAHKARRGVPGYAPTDTPVASAPDESASPPERTAVPEPGPSRRVARLYTPSEKARALELAAEIGVTVASKELGISRFSLYEWRRRVKLAAAGKGDSPTSGSDPADIEAQRDKEILDLWHKHPGLGPSQVRNQLRRQGVKVAVNTVRRVMEEAGYRPPKVKRDAHTERYEAVRPNHLWHLDFIHRHINRTNTFTLILIDDHSRFVVGHGVDDAERADMVTETFTEAVGRHGRPEAVMHDKGSAFWSWRGISRFTALLTELGIDQVVAEHKEWNGKVEVFNGNLAKELFDVQRFYDVGEMKRRLQGHLHWYNHRRTHHALGGLLVPADRYYGRVEEVLARIEAGAGAGVHTDLLDLRARALELFKVVSRDGKPEVWLLGQPLLALATK
ncbi:MAG: DDE-type integrase/transposase/recombinase [Candidatus Methylomirabilis sp.]|nr:DDE-type integrase/transposase/recombinase [Deltaproteobacteria bacterium]